MNKSAKQQYQREQESGGFKKSSHSSLTHDKHRSTLHATPDQTTKIHVDVTQNPSDKLLLTCDSSEPSPRDLTDTVLSSLPTHKVCSNKYLIWACLYLDKKTF